MDERSRKLAAAKQKLQMYKHQKQQAQPGHQQTEPIAPATTATENGQSPVDFHSYPHTHTHAAPIHAHADFPVVAESQGVRTSGRSSPFGSVSFTESYNRNSTESGSNPNSPTTVDLSSYTVTPLIPIFTESSTSENQSYELGISQQYSYANHNPVPAPVPQQSDESLTASDSIGPIQSVNNVNSSPSVHGDIEEGQLELRSMQHHGHTDNNSTFSSPSNTHHYFSEYQQQSSAGQDAFELEFSQLRQDNAHLARRETELIGHLQENETILQDLRRERDALAQEVRSELGPMKDKVNSLFEENQAFRQKLEEMTKRVETAEAEKAAKDVMHTEMENSFIIVSNAKMELAEKLDLEKERIKVLELTLHERNAQIDVLTKHNQELLDGAALLEKELDEFTSKHVDLEQEQKAPELKEAHAKIVLLEKEVSELQKQLRRGFSGNHKEDQESQDKHNNHGHDAHGHSHQHGKGHSHSHKDSQEHHHDKSHGHCQDHDHSNGHGKSHEHSDHGHEQDQEPNYPEIHQHSQTNPGEHSREIGTQPDCTHNNRDDAFSESELDNHGHSHDLPHTQEDLIKNGGGGHGHSHSHEGEGHSHSQPSEFGKGGHALSAIEKRQARLEWENQTYKDELEKLVALLKMKTADASALCAYKNENDKMKNELARLEHMVIQLQGENDTIGDYVTLYQSQRLALKEKAMQKEAEMVILSKEREQLRIQMNELNQILRSYRKDENKHQELPVQKINELITDINTNFHPCGVCSGRLMNV